MMFEVKVVGVFWEIVIFELVNRIYEVGFEFIWIFYMYYIIKLEIEGKRVFKKDLYNYYVVYYFDWVFL